MIRRNLSAAPGLVAALLPNVTCPACWPVYAGVLSAVGLGFLMQGAYFYIVVSLLLAISLASLFYRARKRHGYGPFILGLAAAATILSGKAYAAPSIVLYGAAGLLVAATIWNNLPVRKGTSKTIETASCACCADTGSNTDNLSTEE